MSLDFWQRLQVRLTAEFQAKKAALAALMQPIPATVDTVALALEQAASNRVRVMEEVARLENLQLLTQSIAIQVQVIARDAGLIPLELRLETMRNLNQLYLDYLVGLPSRLAPEQDLKLAAEQYANLRTQGSAESAVTERARLRALTRDIRVLGLEEGGRFETDVRSMQTTIDLWDAELKALRVKTETSVRCDPPIAALLAEYSVQVFPVELAQPIPTVEGVAAPDGEPGASEVTDDGHSSR